MARSCVFPKFVKFLKMMKSKETNVTEDLAPFACLEVVRRIKDGARKSLDGEYESRNRLGLNESRNLSGRAPFAERKHSG